MVAHSLATVRGLKILVAGLRFFQCPSFVRELRPKKVIHDIARSNLLVDVSFSRNSSYVLRRRVADGLKPG